VSAPAPVWAVLPTKCFARGKSRLAGALDEAARERLARALFDRVLAALCASPQLGGVLVATDCGLVAARARRRGALALVTGAPLAESIEAALGAIDKLTGQIAADTTRRTARAARTGASGRTTGEARAAGALVVMSDLPRIVPADVARMVTLLDEHQQVIAPDERDEGTNALAVRLADRPPTCFGHADSFARHLARARAARLDAAVYRERRVGFDVDWPRDLPRL
jgi:2-phospho-L-lactate guanylyltransferase